MDNECTKNKSVGAEAELTLDLPRTRTWNLLMTTCFTEMFFFRSQVRYPITPADPGDECMVKKLAKNILSQKSLNKNRRCSRGLNWSIGRFGIWSWMIGLMRWSIIHFIAMQCNGINCNKYTVTHHSKDNGYVNGCNNSYHTKILTHQSKQRARLAEY